MYKRQVVVHGPHCPRGGEKDGGFRVDPPGAWVEHPTQFSNDYATDMLGDEWTLVDSTSTWLDAQGSAELRPAAGNRQYVNQRPRGPGEEQEEDVDPIAPKGSARKRASKRQRK